MSIITENIRVVHPLFATSEDGTPPTSPTQFEIEKMPIKVALNLNYEWHSRMPELTNWQGCIAYGAFFLNVYYAVAIWGRPVAREFNGRGYLELRRMAISGEAPRNTASRMIKIMRQEIQREMPDIVKLISYQDTTVHLGTIYKASGWVIGGQKKAILYFPYPLFKD